MLPKAFFHKDAIDLAKDLLGKAIMVYDQTHAIWLQAQIIETEAYYLSDKASHASLGYTEKRKALFMPAGTIYMYYSRAGDSLNVSAAGEGNAVLIKSAIPNFTAKNFAAMIAIMQKNNPHKNHTHPRDPKKLCSGQTLLCKSLGLKVKDWDQKQFDRKSFYIKAVGYKPETIIETTRLGIPEGRDGHLPYRFIDAKFEKYSTAKRNLKD